MHHSFHSSIKFYTTGNNHIVSGRRILPNTWLHLTIVITGRTSGFRVYLDGTGVGSSGVMMGVMFEESDNYIMISDGRTSVMVDELTVWAFPLDVSDVQMLYESY